MKIDSDISREQALADNPRNPAPLAIRNTLEVIGLVHIGLDKQLHVGQIVVASDVAADVKDFFQLAMEEGFPIEKVIPASAYDWDDEQMMQQNNSSGFNYRTVAGSDQLSLHALGRAFDINPRQNPYIRYEQGKAIIRPDGAIWGPNQPGALHRRHPLVRLMEDRGWTWGGRWTPDSGRTDYQHFEKAA